MRFSQIFVKASSSSSHSRNRSASASSLLLFTASRSFSHLRSPSQRPSFGIAFDIDGVILRGNTPIGGSPQALGRLYHDSFGTLKVPYVFLTNELQLFLKGLVLQSLSKKTHKEQMQYQGGGVPESKRAFELSKLLGVNILPSQVIQGHTPFKQLVKRFENDLIIAVGKGEPATVMSEYGFKNAFSIDEYASCFDNIDPLAQFKKWTTGHVNQNNTIRSTACTQRVHAAFIVSDSVDWSRDIQVVIHPNALEYTSFGKPNPSVFRNAETVLMETVPSSYQSANHVTGGNHVFRTLYMIGDNPSVDIKGAKQAGHPWFSILTRTGVFKGKKNHAEHPADLVVDTVEEAVDYIFRKEGISGGKQRQLLSDGPEFSSSENNGSCRRW
ncbi:unnamed protein product [Camellia sinensis]